MNGTLTLPSIPPPLHSPIASLDRPRRAAMSAAMPLYQVPEPSRPSRRRATNASRPPNNLTPSPVPTVDSAHSIPASASTSTRSTRSSARQQRSGSRHEPSPDKLPPASSNASDAPSTRRNSRTSTSDIGSTSPINTAGNLPNGHHPDAVAVDKQKDKDAVVPARTTLKLTFGGNKRKAPAAEAVPEISDAPKMKRQKSSQSLTGDIRPSDISPSGKSTSSPPDQVSDAVKPSTTSSPKTPSAEVVDVSIDEPMAEPETSVIQEAETVKADDPEIKGGDEVVGDKGDDKLENGNPTTLEADVVPGAPLAQRKQRTRKKYFRKGEIDPEDTVALAARDAKHHLIDEAIVSIDEQIAAVLAETHPQLLDFYASQEKKRDKLLRQVHLRHAGDLHDLQVMRDEEKRRVRSTFWNRTEQLRDQFNEDHRLKKRVLQKEKDELDPYKIQVNISAERRWRSGLLSHDSTRFVPVRVGDRLLRRRDVDPLPLSLRFEDIKSDLVALGLQYDDPTHEVTHPPYEPRAKSKSRRRSRVEAWIATSANNNFEKAPIPSNIYTSSTPRARTAKSSVATPSLPSVAKPSSKPSTTSNRNKSQPAAKTGPEEKPASLNGDKWPTYKPESYESWKKRHPGYYQDSTSVKDTKPNLASSSTSVDSERRQMLPPPLPASSNASAQKSTTEAQGRPTSSASSTSGFPDYSRPASSLLYSRPGDSGRKPGEWQSPLLRPAWEKTELDKAAKSRPDGSATASTASAASATAPKTSDAWSGYYRKPGMNLKGFDAATSLALRSLDPWIG